MTPIHFKVAKHLSEEFWQQTILRFITLRLPIDLPFEISKFRTEFEDVHIIGTFDGRVVGSVVLSRIDREIVRIRAVAVDPTLQGSGIGAMLMEISEDHARDAGYKSVMLHARENVIGFYERIGYVGQGGLFEEVGVPHLRMVKGLCSA